MRIALVEIENFRGIKELNWAPSTLVNCLIGPGDSTKTTIIDAIELALNPRSYPFADDSDFFDLDTDKTIKVTVTLTRLPAEFRADNRYGLHLRGWNAEKAELEDEPREGLEDALSLRVVIDGSLEARWSIYNERIPKDEEEPPGIRFKDSKRLATTRLGPYAERHLGWGRQSVLTRLGDAAEKVSLQLAQANRAAREAFRKDNANVFKTTVERAEVLGKHFSVPVRAKYAAELDVQGVNITAGGIALHDGKLPLRRLGAGSSRLIVSALQHDAGGSHIALIDEIEHGLEPHRIARLLKFLKTPPDGTARTPQIFMTTHSPVVIQELGAADIFAVRSEGGITVVRSVSATAAPPDSAQRHLRGAPGAFLAKRVIVCEGRTEQGLLRGLDLWWSAKGKDSFALCGVTAVDGGGVTKAPVMARHLCELKYGVFMLLDSDTPADQTILEAVRAKGGSVHEWPDKCSTEERIFLDVPWEVVVALVKQAIQYVGDDSVRDSINNACKASGLATISDLSLPTTLDVAAFRRALGIAAKNSNNSWFKDIARGEALAEIIAPCLNTISATPLAQAITSLRQWIDA